MFNEIKHPHLFGFGALIILGLIIFFLISQDAESEIRKENKISNEVNLSDEISQKIYQQDPR